MSWCTAAEVAELIRVSRLHHGVAEAERKAADLRLIELHASAVNFGDALVEVAAASDALSCSVRLAAALTLESFVTERGWCEGVGFSDKERVLAALLMSLRGASLATAVADVRLNSLLCSCLCRIICFEYPTTCWDAFIDECVSAVVSADATEQQAGCGLVQRTILLRLAENCASKAALWWRLASDVVRRLVEWAKVYGGGGESRVLCLRVVLHLMRRRPRLSEVTEAERPTSSFIFSDEFRGIVGRSLEEGASAFESRGPCTPLLEECGLLLDVAQHLLSDDSFARVVFRATIYLLSSCEAAYLAGVAKPTQTPLRSSFGPFGRFGYGTLTGRFNVTFRTRSYGSVRLPYDGTVTG
ncbi:hypothetical protein TRSC58_05259 [Trypanosoma rangeli SC58]|uniref:Uncharacterized protein n=1 Tax=Trypanosoma rangeli SC58 TaxID=429131 RepID=A0A061IVB2_TRYRA|nr:hypothetical protein TRSC58_05259 [Trypanosoma rangeli SC58]